MKVMLAAALTKAETRVDGSIKLVFDTRELTGDAMATLFKLARQEGWLVFASHEDTITEIDIPDEKPNAMLGTKTQAQRLRAALFVLWKQRGEKGNFDDFYKQMTERFIDWVKEKLEGEA